MGRGGRRGGRGGGGRGGGRGGKGQGSDSRAGPYPTWHDGDKLNDRFEEFYRVIRACNFSDVVTDR